MSAITSPPQSSSAPRALDDAARIDRRAHFLQLVTESLGTHLADNIDYLFHVGGQRLPPVQETGLRLAQQLAVLERADVLWSTLGDESSRSLLLRYLAYRALGPQHVRLQLEPEFYRSTVIALNRFMERGMEVSWPGQPLEWQLHLYDFTAAGMPIRVAGSPLPIASTVAFGQYGYRDETVAGRPKQGDVILDIGGCWGDTALWFAHGAGSDGTVHTFEPTPRNRVIIEQNLARNPGLARRITVWDEAIWDRVGEIVSLPDTCAGDAAVLDDAATDQPTVDAVTDTIDNMVTTGAIEPPNFIKVDVGGAELAVLRGAAETILEHRPVLAIAIYHKVDDLVTIPDFVASLGAEYDWYLQCATMTDIDTVAFAVPA